MRVRRRPGRRGPVAALATVLCLALLAACGSSSPPPDPATVIPAAAPLYLGVTVHPGGTLGADALSAARRATGHQAPFAQIESMIASLAGSGVDFSRDIEPWLGPRAGAFFTSLAGGVSLSAASRSAGAAVVDVSDHGAASSFLARATKASGAHAASYRGVSYELTPGGVAYGFVGPFVVIGARSAVEAVIATHTGAGPALSASATYARQQQAATADAVAALHVGARPLVATLPASTSSAGDLALLRAVLASSSIEAIDATLQVPSATSLVLSGTVTDSGAGPAGGESAAQVFAALPGDSWLALGTGSLGPALERALAILPSSTLGSGSLAGVVGLLRTLDGGSRHLLHWAGPAGIFAAGAGLLDLTAAVVITTSDDAAARAAVAPIAAQIGSGAKPSPISVPGTDAGASVPLSGLPVSVQVVHAPGKVVIGIGAASIAAALRPKSTLGSSAVGTAAARTLGGGVPPSLLIDFPTLVSVVGTANQVAGSPILGTLPAVTNHLGDVVGGTLTSGATRRLRLVLQLQ